MKTQPWIDNPYRLISWLEMLKFSGDDYFFVGWALRSMEEVLPKIEEAKLQGSQLDVDMRKIMASSAIQISKHLKNIGLSALANSAARLADDFPTISKEVAKARSNELMYCVMEELERNLFFWVPPERGKYYIETEGMFGNDVKNAFPSAMSEIREAGNALAFGLFTASVFHLMRVMEIGLRAVDASLGLTYDPNASWGTIVKRWSPEDIKNDPVANERLKARLEFYRDVRATVASVKDSWRNKTMHFDRSYGESEALEIMTAVKGFMRCVAGQMDENGIFFLHPLP